MPSIPQNLVYSLCYSLRLPKLIDEHTLSSTNYDYSCISANSFKYESIILSRERAAYTHNTCTHTMFHCGMIVQIKIQQMFPIFNFIKSLTKYCNFNKLQVLLKICHVTFIKAILVSRPNVLSS